MKGIQFKTPCIEDIEFIAANMSDRDTAEVLAYSNHTPLQALMYSLDSSFLVNIVYYDGEPVGVFGCAVLNPNSNISGSPWLLGTDKLRSFPTEFIRRSKEVLSLLQKTFCILKVDVHSKNKVSLKWLKSLGFSKTKELIRNKEVFYTMSIDRYNKRN